MGENKVQSKPNKAFDYKAFKEHEKTPAYWGGFDMENGKHRYILSLLHQLKWVFVCKRTGRDKPDVERLGTWLQSEKSPVKKPLRKMTPVETSKIITAMEEMVGKKYK